MPFESIARAYEDIRAIQDRIGTGDLERFLVELQEAGVRIRLGPHVEHVDSLWTATATVVIKLPDGGAASYVEMCSGASPWSAVYGAVYRMDRKLLQMINAEREARKAAA